MDAINWSPIMTAIWQWVVAGSGLANDHVLWSYYKQLRPTAPYVLLSLTQVRAIGHDWTTSEENELTIALTAQSISVPDSTITIPNHGLHNGDGPIQLTTTGTLPTPLALNTNYWTILIDANTIQLATTYQRTGGQQPLGAGNPITPITFTATGTGLLSAISTADTVPAGQEIIRRAQGYREITISLECFAQEGAGIDAVRILTNTMAAMQLYIYPIDLAGFGMSDFGQGFSQDGIRLIEGHRGSILEPRAMTSIVGYCASDFTGFDTIIEQVQITANLTNIDGAALASIPLQIDIGSG